MKKILYSVAAVALLFTTSCSDFLERAPQDALSPSTFWKTDADAKLALNGIYNGLNNIYHNGHWTGMNCVMMDALSDDLFDYFGWEGYQVPTTGNLKPTDNGVGGSWFSFSDIRACNEYLEMEENVAWSNTDLQKQYAAEAKTIRAALYQFRSQFYGDFPLIKSTIATPDEAYEIGRNPKAEVDAFIESELKEAIPGLLNKSDAANGQINKQFAQGLLMRHYMSLGNYDAAAPLAEDILNNGGLKLADNYEDMWLTGNQIDEETIFTFSFIASTDREFNSEPFLPNGAYGGWSSVVPTHNLVEAFECIDGKTIEESPLYNDEYPYRNRDPRLHASVLYSGQQYPKYASGYFNSMPEVFKNGDRNPDFWKFTGNSTNTGLNLKKYFRYENITSVTHTTLHFKAMRLAEVILSLAECYIEQGTNLEKAAELMNMTRERAYRNNVYGVEYPKIVASDQATMREQVRRERRMELSGEGLRRFDLCRWGILTQTFQNFAIIHYDGDLTDEVDEYGDLVAHKTGIEDNPSVNKANFQTFKDYQRWWPISQGTIDVTTNIAQTAGY